MRGYVANRYASTLLEDGMTENLQRGAQSLLESAGVSPERAEAIAPFAAIIPEFVPGIGEAVGVDNTKRAAQEGNYGEALFEGAMTGLGSIPVIGDLAKYAIFAGLGAKGANKAGAAAAVKNHNEHYNDLGFDKYDVEDTLTSAIVQAERSRDAGSQRQSWFVGPDGKPRYEINDQKAKIDPDLDDAAMSRIYDGLNQDYEYQYPLSQILHHNPLFNAYPQLQDMPVLIVKGEDIGNTSAAYMPPIDKLVKKHPEFKHGGIFISADDALEHGRGELLNSVLHETQHAIQNLEGFSPGANASAGVDEVIDAHVARVGEGEMSDYLRARVAEARKWDDTNIEELGPHAARRHEQELEHTFYRMSAGEAEARAVEARRALSAGERQLRVPHLDYKGHPRMPDGKMSLFEFIN